MVRCRAATAGTTHAVRSWVAWLPIRSHRSPRRSVTGSPAPSSGPTAAQAQAWPAIAGGENVLVSAPTGSGKTLAAFLWGLDRLVAEPEGERDAARLRLAAEGALLRRREEPARAAAGHRRRHLGRDPHRRHAAEASARRCCATPPDVLITTPESLYLMLTSRAREFLAEADSVIVDEIHAVAQTKRGAHLALTLERLEHVAGRPLQRDRPVGHPAAARGGRPLPRRPGPRVQIVDAGVRKPLDLKIHVPVDDMSEPGAHDVTDPAVGGRARPRAAATWSATAWAAPRRPRPRARSGRRSTRSCSSWSGSTARRSSS